MNTILLIHIGGEILPLYAALCERLLDFRIESARLSPRYADNSALCAALERLINEGVKELIIVPLCLKGGAEYTRICDIALSFKPRLRALALTPPLLRSEAGLDALADIAVKYGLSDGVDAAVLVGHGGENNADLLGLEERLKMRGYGNILVGAINGAPDIDAVTARLKGAHYRKVRVMPLTLNYGVHASRDICGLGENAWTGALIERGLDAVPLKRGLSEYGETAELILSLIISAREGRKEI